MLGQHLSPRHSHHNNHLIQQQSSHQHQYTSTQHQRLLKSLPDPHFVLSGRKQFPSDINDYSIGQVIGKGGFAVVYAALSKGSDTYGDEVAIKALDKNQIMDSKLLKRVLNEITIHWQLDHPSILRLLTYFEDDSRVYLVSEYCPNEELFRYLQARKSQISEAEARTLIRQIVGGLTYMHSRGIMHRDLKLSNLLLTKSWDVKIADFGLATCVEDGAEQKTMCGTPNYISPEIVSRLPYGLTSDLWSLGCMIVTILTGRPPFDTGLVKGTLEKVSRVDYCLPDHLSEAIKDLVKRLLVKDPNSRISLNEITRHPWLQLPQLPLRPVTTSHSPVPPGSPEPELAPPQKCNHYSVSLSTDNEFSALFSTKRLKPIRQKTRHGTIEIDDKGSIIIDFASESTLVVIDGEGTQVTLMERGTFGTIQRIRIDDSPARISKMVKYAQKFVELVQSKTPKIVFFSPQAKCVLMENSPTADYEMQFYNGVHLFHSARTYTFKITFPAKPVNKSSTPSAPEEFIFNLSPSEKLEIPAKVSPIFRHMQECLQQCLDIDKSLQTDQNSATTYPVTVKSANYNSTNSADLMNASPVGKISRVGSIVSQDAQSEFVKRPNGKEEALVESSHALLLRQPFEPRKPEPQPVSSSASSCLPPLPTYTPRTVQPSNSSPSTSPLTRPSSSHLHNAAAASVVGSLGGGTTLVASSASVIPEPHSLLEGLTAHYYHSSQELTDRKQHQQQQQQPQDYLLIPGVAWCTYEVGQNFVLLFFDGVQLSVSLKQQTVTCVNGQGGGGESVKYTINKSLPSDIKRRLSHLPLVLKHFRTITGNK